MSENEDRMSILYDAIAKASIAIGSIQIPGIARNREELFRATRLVKTKLDEAELWATRVAEELGKLDNDE